ncbi:seven-hairpin glycosidase [Sistotremastrum niveocremeum HHB9708]|uniref:alpha-1,2-Mannosidase n=1 Tax=Sistotremastrum niveocremeum HHB9708 TaxID=1314777 RepID=A0A164Y2B5_9AGAM|nr:seven-hairpin glycosidase [Sistotremastrum niveocremeum HHB9708]
MDRIIWTDRAGQVKSAFLHAWNSYEKYAWGYDEVLPISVGSTNNFNGWGVSIVDSLDTLLLLGLGPQFDRAMDHVNALNFTQSQHDVAPFFETTIRYLGGLLSAYALIANTLLTRADQLGLALLHAFNTTSGLPAWGVNTVTHRQQNTYSALLAEIGSCQMEYKYLAYLTGRKEYFDTVNDITDRMERAQLEEEEFVRTGGLNGMWGTRWDIGSGESVDQYIAVGALADSAYEYLLKGYLLSGRTEKRLLDMYLAASTTALQNLTYISPTRNLLYITDSTNAYPSHKFEHLSCFFPGLLSLGDKTRGSFGSSYTSLLGPLTPSQLRDRHSIAAQGVAETCWVLYGDNPTGLGSETVLFDRPTGGPTYDMSAGRWWDAIDAWESVGRKGALKGSGKKDKKEKIKMDYTVQDARWLMRPETLESLFLMYRYTGDEVWRERCWKVFEGMEKYSRLGQSGEGGGPKSKNLDDKGDGYALAETFKYIYLCLLDPSESEALLPKDKWIFNTEAHPFPVFEWSERQIEEWGIR